MDAGLEAPEPSRPGAPRNHDASGSRSGGRALVSRSACASRRIASVFRSARSRWGLRLAILACSSNGVSAVAAPVVVSTVPPDHAVGVPLGTSVTIQFAAALDPSTLVPEHVTVTSSLQGTVPAALSWSPATLTLTIDPQENMVPGERVEVALTKGVRDSQGAPLPNGWRTEFSSWTATAPGGGFVTSGTTWPTGSIAFNVTPGDLTGDGFPELVFSNVVPDSLTIFTPDGQGGFSLLARIQRPDATLPRHVAISDLDADGLPDLVVCASGPNRVEVFRNLGAGAFAAPALYPTGQTPYGAYVGDVDADGDLDVATANFNSHDVSVLRNLGAGVLGAPVHYSAGPGADSPRWVDGADLDDDGDVDLAVCNGYSNDVSVLLNNGSGVFVLQTPLHPVDESPQFLATRDLTGDGIADIVTVNSIGESVSLLAGIGDGSFAPAVHTTVAGQFPYGLQVIDLDGDDDLDLVLPIRGASAWQPIWNDATGVFTAGALHFGGTHCHTVGAADWDGDGDIDVAAGFAITRTLQYYEQVAFPTLTQMSPARNATGVAVHAPIDLYFNVDLTPASLAPSAFAVCGAQSGVHTVSVTWAAAERRVRLTPLVPFLPGESVAVTSKGGGAITSEEGVAYPGDLAEFMTSGLNSTGTFASAPRVGLPGIDPVDAVACDFDEDGRSDLAVANLLSNDVTTLLSSAGTPAVAQTIAIGAPPVSMTPGDFDSDGDADLAVAAGSAQVVILRNDGGTLTAAGTPAVAGSPFALAAGDLDRDGDLDLAAALLSPNAIGLLRNDGGVFAAQGSWSIPGPPTDIALADFDGDGALDVAATIAATETVRILTGDGAGTLDYHGSYAAPQAPVGLFPGDLDGDGAADLAVPGFTAGELTLLENLGSATFAPATALISASLPRSVWGADLNGDGTLDLATAGSGDGLLTVLCAEGGGSWCPPWTAMVGDTPYALTGGDFDGDGRVDLAVVNRASSDVSFLWAVPAVGAPEAAIAGAAFLRIWPNPFVDAVAMEIRAPDHAGSARLAIHDVAGRMVVQLLDDSNVAGTRTLRWDGRDRVGRRVAAGVYFVRFETPTSSSVGKLLRIR